MPAPHSPGPSYPTPPAAATVEPVRVWLLRHAETAAPAVFHGAESDVELGETGHRQAAALADWFRPMEPDRVVSSAMRRAVHTATPIATAAGVPLAVEPALHERRVGTLGGTRFSLTDGAWPETVRRWTSGDTGYTTPGAESFDELRTRLLPAFERAVHGGRRVVVVAHGVVCKVLLLSLLDGHGPANWNDLGRVANGAVSELARGPDGRWTAGQLLTVPPPVAQIPAGGPKSEG